MSHEEVMKWFVKVTLALIWIACVVSGIIVIGFVSGYVSEIKDPKCINSACENPCKEKTKFIRHQGCLK